MFLLETKMSLPFTLHCITSYNDSRVQKLLELSELAQVIAVDTEFDSREAHGLHLIQIAVKIEKEVDVFVFDLRAIGGIQSYPLVSKLLENDKITKVGCGLESDLDRLIHNGVRCRTFVDIQHIARAVGFPRVSLNEISTTLLRDRKMVVSHSPSKKGDSSLEYNYAAYDAYLTLMSFFALVPYRHPLSVLLTESQQNFTESDVIEFWRWARPYIIARGDNIMVSALKSSVFQYYNPWTLQYPRTKIFELYEESLQVLVKMGLIEVENDIITIRTENDYYLPPIPKVTHFEPRKHVLQLEISPGNEKSLSEPPVTKSLPLAHRPVSLYEPKALYSRSLERQRSYYFRTPTPSPPSHYVPPNPFEPPDQFIPLVSHSHPTETLPFALYHPKNSTSCQGMSFTSWCLLVVSQVKSIHHRLDLSYDSCLKMISNECWNSIPIFQREIMAKVILQHLLEQNLVKLTTQNRIWVDPALWETKSSNPEPVMTYHPKTSLICSGMSLSTWSHLVLTQVKSIHRRYDLSYESCIKTITNECWTAIHLPQRQAMAKRAIDEGLRHNYARLIEGGRVWVDPK